MVPTYLLRAEEWTVSGCKAGKAGEAGEAGGGGRGKGRRGLGKLRRVFAEAMSVGHEAIHRKVHVDTIGFRCSFELCNFSVLNCQTLYLTW